MTLCLAPNQATTMIGTSSLIQLSYLETTSVLPTTLHVYQVLMRAFVLWCRRNAMNWDESNYLDTILVLYFDQLFWYGLPSSHGSKVLASIKFFIPDFSKQGIFHLPRCHRCLLAWHKHRLRICRRRLAVAK